MSSPLLEKRKETKSLSTLGEKIKDIMGYFEQAVLKLPHAESM